MSHHDSQHHKTILLPDHLTKRLTNNDNDKQSKNLTIYSVNNITNTKDVNNSFVPISNNNDNLNVEKYISITSDKVEYFVAENVDEPDKVVRLTNVDNVDIKSVENAKETIPETTLTTLLNENKDRKSEELQEISPTTELYENEFDSEPSNIKTTDNDFEDQTSFTESDSDSSYLQNRVGGLVTEVKGLYDEVTTTTDVPDYDLVLETLVSTVTLYNDDKMQDLRTGHRVQRTISQPEYGYNEYRGFPSDSIVPSLSTFMSVESLNPDDYKNARKSEADPDIDDIIHGIMKILGGNVKLEAAESTKTKLTTYGGAVFSSRVNNRGPPRLPVVPFGALPPSPQYSGLPLIPLRSPITPPNGNKPNKFPPGDPVFVANTKPPFLAPLPPSLSSRPPVNNQNPSPLTPFTDDPSEYDSTLPISNESENENLIPNEGGDFSNTLLPSLTSSIDESITTENINNNIVDSLEVTENLPDNTFNDDFPQRLTNNLAGMEFIPSTMKTISVIPTSNTITEPSSVAILSSSLLKFEKPVLTPTSSSSQSKSLGFVTSSSTQVTLQEPSYITTESQDGSEITEPALMSTGSTPPLTTPQVHWTLKESPSYSSSTSEPEAPPVKITPVAPQYNPRPGVVVDEPVYRPGQVITGAVIPYGNNPGDVFDVTVSAYQDFGGNSKGKPSRGGHNKHGRPHVIPGEL